MVEFSSPSQMTFSIVVYLQKINIGEHAHFEVETGNCKKQEYSGSRSVVSSAFQTNFDWPLRYLIAADATPINLLFLMSVL